jgi:hypothetical protein
MPTYVSISDVKRNPAVLSHAGRSGMTIVMKNNRPLYVTVPYVEGIEERLEDFVLGLRMLEASGTDVAPVAVLKKKYAGRLR